MRDEEKRKRHELKVQEIQESYRKQPEIKSETTVVNGKQENEESIEKIEGSETVQKAEIVFRLRLMKQPATLFGESDEDRYQRLLMMEEKIASDMKKSDKDETAKSFVPEDQEIELLKFLKQ